MTLTLMERELPPDAFTTGNGGSLVNPQSHAARLALSSVALLGCLSGTSLAAPQPISTITVLVGGTRSAGVKFVPDISAVDVLDEGADRDGTQPLSDRDEVAWVKDNSGLTWDQLGKVFGVSRRAVHMWANGGRLNESNARRLREFSAVIRSIVDSTESAAPEDVRAQLLKVGLDGLSVIDRMRNERSNGATRGAPFELERFIDVRREPGRTTVSEVDL